MAKRSGILLTMVLLLLLTTMGPAAGGPTVDCDAKPNHPFCSDPEPVPDHPDGGTCAASGNAWMTATDGFTVEFTDKLLCVDWTTTKETDWRITVWPSGKRLAAMATVRDSHPGDWCWRADDTWQTTDGGRALTTVMDSIPIAGIDACGTEYTDVADPPEEAIPFALTLGYQGKTSGVVVVVEEATP